MKNSKIKNQEIEKINEEIKSKSELKKEEIRLKKEFNLKIKSLINSDSSIKKIELNKIMKDDRFNRNHLDIISIHLDKLIPYYLINDANPKNEKDIKRFDLGEEKIEFKKNYKLNHSIKFYPKSNDKLRNEGEIYEGIIKFIRFQENGIWIRIKDEFGLSWIKSLNLSNRIIEIKEIESKKEDSK